MEHAFADLGDVRLHYVTAGSGFPVVLLHGWPQSWHEWRHIIPGLSERFRVIAPHLRGLGDSSRPAAGYDKKTIGNDIWRLVRDVLGISEPLGQRRDHAQPALKLSRSHDGGVAPGTGSPADIND